MKNYSNRFKMKIADLDSQDMTEILEEVPNTIFKERTDRTN